MPSTKYNKKTQREEWMTNQELCEEKKKFLSWKLGEIENELNRIEGSGDIHTERWRKLIKQKLGIIRILKEKD